MSFSILQRLSVAAVLIVAATFPGLAASLDTVTERGKLRFAVYRDFPPFSRSVGGTLEGVDVDLAKAIGEKLGLGVEFMELTADENMDDDLRNAVWKGHYLGGGVADVMMHVPVNRVFEQRNDLVVIFGAYQRETFAVARDPSRISETAGFPVFQTEKVGVELDTVPDFFLSGAFGGRLRENVVHYSTVEQAVDGLRGGRFQRCSRRSASWKALSVPTRPSSRSAGWRRRTSTRRSGRSVWRSSRTATIWPTVSAIS